MKVVAEENGFLVPIHQKTHALAARLGYSGYLDMMAGVKTHPLVPVRDEMRRFLKRTDALYTRELERSLQERLGIPLAEGIENHAAYLSNWLKSLKNDPSFIFRASTQASKAADYLLSFRSSPVSTSLKSVEPSKVNSISAGSCT